MFFRNLLLLSGLAAIVLSDPIPQFGNNNPFTNDPFGILSSLGITLTDLTNPFTDPNYNPFTDPNYNPLTDTAYNPFTDTYNPFTDTGNPFTNTLVPSPSNTQPLPTGSPGPITSAGPAPTGNPLAGMPTLPASVQAVLATAVPSSLITANPCQFTAGTPGWAQSLPATIQSQLMSYESAMQSWLSNHPAVSNPCTGGSHAQSTSVGSSGNGNGNSNGKGPTGAAPRPTGALGASLAGVVGLLGIMIAL